MSQGLQKVDALIPLSTAGAAERPLDGRREEQGESMLDRYTDDRAPGRVIGTTAATGAKRSGVDREGVIGIDNGALRIQPLINAGWGRSGIAYGPYPRSNGLAFGAFLLNGHNTSQFELLPDGLKMRLGRWALGAESAPPLVRLRKLLGARQRRYLWRRLLQWIRTGTRFRHVATIDQNLAVGWYATPSPGDPNVQGNGFVMHALGPECGELRTRAGMRCLSVVKGVQNLPIYYLIVLREQGAAYYAASLPGAPGFASFPRMRPLAIDPNGAEQKVHAGIHQSVLGQIGFRVDSRVYAAQVITLAEYRNWFGSAQVADRLVGQGDLHGSPAEAGGTWRVTRGSLLRTAAGVVSGAQQGTALLSAAEPAGLVHMLVKTGARVTGRASIVWRARGEHDYWCFEVDGRQSCLSVVEGGVEAKLPMVADRRLLPNCDNTLQVSDDGECVQVFLNGEALYGGALRDYRLSGEAAVGFQLAQADEHMQLRCFEAHPRSVPIPDAFKFDAPWMPRGERIVASDDFTTAADDLDGLLSPVGQKRWRREFGTGRLQPIARGGARVCASVEKPCPGRTAYTIPWDIPDFADVEVTITPPGTQRGNREKGRGGLIFAQDADNYITLSVFVDDWYGTSIAAFFHVDGFEELYDAVWTNVGRRIHWGVPYEFRVVFDGSRFLAYVDGEPVLYRALSDIYPDWQRMDIRSVGMVANWEWGNDTGSLFERFVARETA
jgi:hypothetical protein